MFMRYNWGLGIGHTYLQTEPINQENLTISEDHMADELYSDDSIGKNVTNLEIDAGLEMGVRDDDLTDFDESGSDPQSDIESIEEEEAEDVDDSDEEFLELTESYYFNY